MMAAGLRFGPMGYRTRRDLRSRICSCSASSPAPERRLESAHRGLVGFAFVAPWVLGFILFTLGPMLVSFYLSFTSYNIVQAPRWVGLENFVAAFSALVMLYS